MKILAQKLKEADLNTGDKAYFQSQEFYDNLISTGVLVVGIIIVGIVINQIIKRLKFTDREMKRRWLIQIRNGKIILFIIGLVAIWAFELKALALSAVAIGMMAFVVGTKEILQCLLGGLYQATVKSFKVGDRIIVDGCRGDVVDRNFLSITLLEVGPKDIVHQYTGKTISIPNSIFLSKSIENETFDDKYMYHVFSIPLKIEDDWKKHEEILLNIANEECAQYVEEIKGRMSELKETQVKETPTINPKVWLHLPKFDEIHLYIRVPTIAQKKGRIEQAIIRKYMEMRPESKKKSKKEKSDEDTSTSEDTTEVTEEKAL